MRLQIRNATVELGANTILEHVNFEIHDREKIAVVGRNGCGKTTLLKLIAGDLEAANPAGDESFAMIVAGGQKIGFLRQINFTDTEITAEREIQKVFQPVYDCERRMMEIESSLTVLPGDSEEAQGLLREYESLQKRFDAMGGHDIQREMEIMFAQFGFAHEELQKAMGTFSGGQQTKIAFIKLLLSKPDILLLDEPTNHLDMSTIEWLEGYLRGYSKAVVVVSHDRLFLDHIVSVVYEIEYGRVTRYAGNYSAFVKQKEEALAKQEKDYEAQQKEIKRLREWIEKWKNTPTKVSSAHSKERAIEHMVLVEKPRRFDTTTFRAHFSPRISSYSEVLDVRNLSIGYDHELCRVSFRLMRGERLAVIGDNGRGKSTLLKTIIGMVPALGGTYKIGTNVEAGYYDQQKAVINNEDPQQTVLDNFWDTYPKLTNEEVRSTLGAFAFSQEEVERKLGQLSGGERVRLALCKIFFTRPNLLILDEPTNHMDILGKESLEKMLKSYEGTVLFVSHDRYFIQQIATQILDISECAPAEGMSAKGKGTSAEGKGTLAEGKGAHAEGKGALAEGTLAKGTSAEGKGASAEGKSAHAEGKGAPAEGTLAKGTSAEGRSQKRPLGGSRSNDITKAAATQGEGPTGSGQDYNRYRNNPGKLRSKLEHKLEKLHAQLEASEQSSTELKKQLEDPVLATDYEKLMQLQSELEKEESRQEEILIEILDAEEQLENL